MKKNILLLTMVILGLSSCFKDDSVANYKMINPIRIEAGSIDAKYTAFALDTLRISPIVYKEGIDDDNLEFYWEISGNLIPPTKIGDKMSLKIALNFAAQGTAYELLFKVTDKTTGIYVEYLSEVEIQSPIGSGLLVCDSKDGIQSDISLVMARNFNTSMKKGADSTINELFSRINGRKLSGIVTATNSNVYGMVRSLSIATTESVERVDPYDFKFMDSNAQMFYVDPGVYKPSGITYYTSRGIELLINDGKIHARPFQSGNKLYGYYLLTANMDDYRVSKMTAAPFLLPLAFDELGGRAFAVNSDCEAIVTLESKDDITKDFQPSKLKGFICLEAFTGNGNTSLRDYHMILEDKITQRRYSYIFDATGNLTTHGMADRIIDLDPAKCPNIGEAIAFNATENQNVIYYATKNKIYAVSYPTATKEIFISEEYTVPDGEEITNMLIWKNDKAEGKIEYANPDPTAEGDKKIIEVAAMNRMIVVASYNPTTKEGIVRTVALVNIGAGSLEKNREFHHEYRGFGKISNISAHKRSN